LNELKQVIAPKTIPVMQEAFKQIEETSITWLAGASFLINARGTIILIDPVLTTQPDDSRMSETGLKLLVDNPISARVIPKVDVVLYTHSDDDHLAAETAKILSKLTPTFIGPPPVFEKLAKLNINPKNSVTCRTGDIYKFGEATIEIVPADHPWQLLDLAKFGKPFRLGDCCGFIVTTPDARSYFPGDTRLMEEHLAIKDLDVLALDASVCTYHLNHYNAVVLANTMKNALLIPFHYGTYDEPDSLALNGDPEDIITHVNNGYNRFRYFAPGRSLKMKDKREIK